MTSKTSLAEVNGLRC